MEIPHTNKSTETLQKFSLPKITGKLLWPAMMCRPDISYAVARLAQMVSLPSPEAYGLAARILRYLRGTISLGIAYNVGGDQDLVAYCDSDWGGDRDRKSQSGYIFFFAGGPIAWTSKKQSTIDLSTAEAEIVAATVCVQEAMWMIQCLTELGISTNLPISIYEDNSAAIALTILDDSI